MKDFVLSVTKFSSFFSFLQFHNFKFPWANCAKLSNFVISKLIIYNFSSFFDKSVEMAILNFLLHMLIWKTENNFNLDKKCVHIPLK